VREAGPDGALGCSRRRCSFVWCSVETTDLVFAVDSIPAIFAVTQDPFIVYTSNVFAILGLRAMYFVLSGAIAKFHFLRFGLGGAGVRRHQDARLELLHIRSRSRSA
jgi:hypothetical protein